MRRIFFLTCALAGFIAVCHHTPALAISADPHPLSAIASEADIQLGSRSGSGRAWPTRWSGRA
jgi:hypothetical protein